MAFVVKDAVHEPLYCVVPYFNPWRWKSREKHTLRALKHFHDAGAVIILVEAAFNRRDLTWADSGLHGTKAECNVLGSREFQHIYVPLRTRDELWLKENLINLGVARIPDYSWQQVCWLDSDVTFARPNWIGEAIHKLQHVKFLQMFSHARDLGPNYELLPENYPHASGLSFVEAWKVDKLLAITERQYKLTHPRPPHPPSPPYYLPRVWPGLAWACTRQAWDEVGGLIDFAIWGGGDHHMAHALIEDPYGLMMRGDLHPNYRECVTQWMERCKRFIRRNLGCMEGLILHAWHGRKTDRGYNKKHALLASVGFDPLTHLKRDAQGVLQLHDDGSEVYIQMRDNMRDIARDRNEDSIDTAAEFLTQGH